LNFSFAHIKLLLILFTCIIGLENYAQISDEKQALIDSLEERRSSETDDSTLVDVLGKLDNEIFMFDPKLDEELNLEIAEICNRKLNENIQLSEARFFIIELANAYNNLGIISENARRLSQSHEYFQMSMQLSSYTKDSAGVASAYNNLGNIYDKLNKHNDALNYYEKALEINQQLDNKFGVVYNNNNIGEVLIGIGRFDDALAFLHRGLKLAEEINFESGKALLYSNYGDLHQKSGSYDLAADYFRKAIDIFEDGEEAMGITNGYKDLAIISSYKAESEENKGNQKQAIAFYREVLEYANKGILLAEKFEFISELSEFYRLMGLANKKLGNYYEALINQENYLETLNLKKELENISAIDRKAFEIKMAQDSIQNLESQKLRDAQIKSQNARIEKDRIIRYGLYLGLLLFLIFGGILYQRFRITKKQKSIIESQKQEVEIAHRSLEEKNTEIIDSINYAQRLQKAILPSNDMLEKHVQNSFVIYRPKDIVAGDFYWLQKVEGKVLIAVADCTGHGVPGAMLSVVCNNALNRAVREYGLHIPGEILDKTREIISSEFQDAQENVRDGMDIALCSIDGNFIEFAGANNPMWMIHADELIEIKATKQPVGNISKPSLYETHRFEVKANTMIYLFSDGFVDQFGGDRGKKFKVKAWRKLLLSLSQKTLLEQKSEINVVFDEWKGDIEQLDDVCVIGFKI
jgi:serine phosphatase RsbU (regulator of sigma subunit)/tetratricopeptide (TPR) repeat protein